MGTLTDAIDLVRASIEETIHTGSPADLDGLIQDAAESAVLLAGLVLLDDPRATRQVKEDLAAGQGAAIATAALLAVETMIGAASS